jgi:hypothetical protein
VHKRLNRYAQQLNAPVPFTDPKLPILKDMRCRECGHPVVRFLSTTPHLLYLHCERCGHQWSEPERREHPRVKA